MGVDGQRQALVDNRINIRSAQSGCRACTDQQLTLDLDLQAVAELAMEGRNGAIVAMDPRTGEILAMAAVRPSIRTSLQSALLSDWRLSLTNRPSAH
jgi:penicillin-binding protein 2